MEDHFECLWDLYRSIPSLEIEGASVLDEFYWLNKDHPNHSLHRATIERGQDAKTGMDFTLTSKARREIIDLVLALPEQLYDKRINEVFDKDFFDSNFWLYWRTMFAFEEWHSALEMKLYVQRFIHHIDGLPDFSTTTCSGRLMNFHHNQCNQKDDPPRVGSRIGHSTSSNDLDY
jgi:oleate hydratase